MPTSAELPGPRRGARTGPRPSTVPPRMQPRRGVPTESGDASEAVPGGGRTGPRTARRSGGSGLRQPTPSGRNWGNGCRSWDRAALGRASPGAGSNPCLDHPLIVAPKLPARPCPPRAPTRHHRLVPPPRGATAHQVGHDRNPHLMGPLRPDTTRKLPAVAGRGKPDRQVARSDESEEPAMAQHDMRLRWLQGWPRRYPRGRLTASC